MSEVKGLTIWILLMIAFGMMFHSVAATEIHGGNTVYVTIEGEFEYISIYRRGESNDYLQLQIESGDEESYFICDLSTPSIFKVFITSNGTTSPALEVNVIWQVDRLLEYDGVLVTFRLDYEPYGTVNGVEMLGVISGAALCGTLVLLFFVLVWESTYSWRRRRKEEYGYEMRLPYPTARHEKRMPIEGHWWIKMINVKLGRDEKEVFE